MNENILKDWKLLWSDFKQYLNIRIQLLKLVTIERTSKFAADLVSNAIVLFFSTAAFLAATVTLAFYLSDLLDSFILGFGAIALSFILISLLFIWKNRAIEKNLAGIVIRRYFEKQCEGDKHEHMRSVKKSN